MKYTEKEVEIIAKKVMADINSAYDEKRGARALEHSLEEQYEIYKKFDGFEENKHKVYAYWTVIFDFPEDEGWGERNVLRVLINDDTGIAYEYGHRQYKAKLIKDEKGKYKIVQY